MSGSLVDMSGLLPKVYYYEHQFFFSLILMFGQFINIRRGGYIVIIIGIGT